jgi:hypothetical protein
MKSNLILSLFIALCATNASARGIETSRVMNYRKLYGLSDALEKKVDNRGQGFEKLYGVRNFRVVLNGILYRGGANNMFHQSNKRSNSNPLPEDGLNNLCGQGFGTAIYLYPTNYKSASPQKSCKDSEGKSHSLSYLQVNPFEPQGMDKILRLVYSNITKEFKGPIYSHCWNGWHASGYVAATALRQFCGASSDEAVRYWDLATDGVNKDKAYERVRRRIRDFKPVSELALAPEQKQMLCPPLESSSRIAQKESTTEPLGLDQDASKMIGVKF